MGRRMRWDGNVKSGDQKRWGLGLRREREQYGVYEKGLGFRKEDR